MDNKTQERIKADAEEYANGIGDVYRKYAAQYGYIAGATAVHDRAQVLVDALEWIKTYGPVNNLTVKFIDKALEQWKGKEQQPEPQPDLGICVECKTRPATTDYNGNQYYVCKQCDDSLNRQFDEEYK